MPIYIAGPVIRSGTQQPRWVGQCYEIIRDFVGSRSQYKALFPVSDQVMETMEPDNFAKEIIQRIRKADSVIAVFLPGDQSVPVECALAATEKKRVLLLHESAVKIPRILAGLSGVTTSPVGPTTYRRIEHFLMGN